VKREGLQAVLLGAVVWSLTGLRAIAQEEPWWTAVWKPLLTYRGVEITYLFYAERDGSYEGVVLRLHNRNDFPVACRFQVAFGPMMAARR